MGLVLVCGGTRSGKSEFAESIVVAQGTDVVYVATMRADDPEMRERAALHRRRRPVSWRTVESCDLLAVLRSSGDAPVLVDGLGGWIASLMEREGLLTEHDVAPLGHKGMAASERILQQVRAFADAAAGRTPTTVVVAEESGWGIVPRGASMRRYVDLAGLTTQALAHAAERVYLVVAGQATELKGARNVVPDELRLHGDTMVAPGHLDFAVNVVPGGPPSRLREEIVSSVDAVSSYPDERSAALAVADLHARGPEEILLTNGSAEAFWLLAHALRPRRAACVHPSFTEPEAALRAAGREVERAFRDRDSFELRPDEIPQDVDLIVLGNPNNPTGNLDAAETLAALVKPGRVLVVDEAFMEFVPGERESLAARFDLPGVVVVRSLTKLWSLPGLRAGYVVGPEDLIAALRAVRQSWSVNALACTALVACAHDRSEALRRACEVSAWRDELARGLRALPGVRVWPSHANFLLLAVPDGASVRAGLLERRIAVRRADTFPGLGRDHLRVAVRTPEDNQLLLAALREVV